MNGIQGMIKRKHLLYKGFTYFFDFFGKNKPKNKTVELNLHVVILIHLPGAQSTKESSNGDKIISRPGAYFNSLIIFYISLDKKQIPIF